jgi:hypothetical protein
MRSSLANSATLSVITGTTCGCWTNRDSGNSEYSKQWHIDNAGSADCLGTGLTSRTTTVTNIKGCAFPPQQIPKYLENLVAIGELQADDLCWIGTVNSSTGAFVELSGYHEERAFITYDSKTYVIRDVMDVGGIGQTALFVRKS